MVSGGLPEGESWAPKTSLLKVREAQRYPRLRMASSNANIQSDIPASELEKNRASFAETWYVVERKMKDNPMTDEEAMELALEAQRWARQQLREEGIVDTSSPLK